jgi:hypothetical protein
MWAIMCCQCHRFLGHNGKMLAAAAKADRTFGYISVDELAEFTTKEAADARAVAAGWSVTEKDGHRCPDCVKIPQVGAGRGAHVWLGDRHGK